MQKFLAVVRHEYKKVVLKWSFVIGTLLLPFLAACFAVVPMIIFSIKGEPSRIAVVDPTGKILPRLERNLSTDRMVEKARKAAKDSMTEFDASQEERMRNSASQFIQEFRLVPFDAAGRPVDEVRTDLMNRINRDEINAFLIVPENISDPNARFEFRSRKGGDFVANDTFRDALNDAVRSQRLADANISEERLSELSAGVDFDAKGIDDSGAEKDTDGVFIASFIIGLMIYITLAIYGQQVLGAVVEEKETRIAEILFSSATPFQLMMGKLVGVGLAGLTQLAIWVGTASALLAFVAMQADASMLLESIPTVTPLMVLYFLIFFLLGFFIYASIFAVIGDPNSSLSFWVTIAPFMAPITMPVRILAETPPFWQILLSFAVNAAAIAGLVWITGRVYRVGMLMYGKRATVPEVWKWIRQA